MLCAAPPAQAQDDVAAFYKGKVVRLLVGIGVGSGYDINARLVARYLPNYIPGNPTVIVQNQPGAGSLSMTNQLYAADRSTAPRSEPRSTGCRPRRSCNPPARASRR
jgi:tripartite-type tricarboxylate transporter receptor subunit TctC